MNPDILKSMSERALVEHLEWLQQRADAVQAELRERAQHK